MNDSDSKTPEPPEGWTRGKFADIFTPEQLQRIADIYNQAGGDMMAMSDLLRPYFESIGPELEAKGNSPVFLAYSVPYWLVQAEEKRLAAEREDAVTKIMGQHHRN